MASIPRAVRWKDDAKVAVKIVVNYEEGSEKTYAMGDEVNDGKYELPTRSRASGISRSNLLRVRGAGRDLADVPRGRHGGHPGHPLQGGGGDRGNPEVAAKIARRGDETVGHGFRRSNHFEMNRDEEREAIRRAIVLDRRGRPSSRPFGWYRREMTQLARARRRGGRVPAPTPTATTTIFRTTQRSRGTPHWSCRTGSE